VKEFRAFILRGNVVDLAIGVVLGAAFGAVMTSLVTDVLTPLLGLLNAPDFSEAGLTVGSARVRYGLFLNAVISFLLIATAIFLFVVKPVNRLMERRKTGPDVETPTSDCPHCLSSIPTAATVCAFCTRDLAA
jgi:large conductance mechanosensitive channel